MNNALELRLKIIETLCKHKGLASSSIIMSELKKKDPRIYPQQVSYHINFLIDKGFLARKGRGIYELNKPINYCLPFLENPVFSLISGLGERRSRNVTVVEVAINRLREQNIFVSKAYVFITKKTRNSWGDHLDNLEKILNINIEFLEIPEDTLYSIDLMNNTLQEIINRALATSIPIIDCTSLTKIYTISAYSLAIKLFLPLIYIYEQNQKLVWIRTIDNVKKEIQETLKKELIT